ncbi:fuzzy-like protein [Plakobranchus ocellatus]|uniref:Fuzzy-like protein n=1 Tax=Plakobranchus ocellatus TaxID=259542 RepID=A0AAV3ZVM3_9GAST|nr:fuzzy-like protein [Plakobranchus ocellatus]
MNGLQGGVDLLTPNLSSGGTHQEGECTRGGCLKDDHLPTLWDKPGFMTMKLPFPVIGSLNAVHMFAANHDAVLKSTTTEDAKIIWKEFENSLVLILVHGRDACAEGEGPGEGGALLPGGRLLDLVWDAMVLLYGKEDLLNIRNVERFKREIKIDLAHSKDVVKLEVFFGADYKPGVVIYSLYRPERWGVGRQLLSFGSDFTPLGISSRMLRGLLFDYK